MNVESQRKINRELLKRVVQRTLGEKAVSPEDIVQPKEAETEPSHFSSPFDEAAARLKRKYADNL